MGIAERKEREKQRRRNDIIDAAEQVFFEKGIQKATMDEVAEKAELSKGTLYLYFGSKEELHLAIKLRASGLVEEMFKKVIDEDVPGIENIYNIGRAYVDFAKKHPDYFRAIMHFEGKDIDPEMMKDPEIKKHIEEDNPLKLLTAVIDKGKADGSVRTDIPSEVMAMNLWGMTNGVMQLLASRWEVLMHIENPVGDEKIIEAMFELIRNGIAQ